MNYTLEEIRKHKNKINKLSNKLINIFDINEEIMINNEIKNETECLLSLLNIKKNEISNINNQNNMNCNMNNNFQQMNHQQMIYEQQQQKMAQFHCQQNMNALMTQQQAMRQAQINNMLNSIGNDNNQKIIYVIFRASDIIAPVTVQCNPEEKVSDIIEKYRNKVNDYDDSKKFIFNSKNLNPSLSLVEAGIKNNSNIFVCRIKGIKGITDDRNS